MGERNWKMRYDESRRYADEQAAKYNQGETITGWRQIDEHDRSKGTETLTGAAWIAWAYEIALEDARTLARHTQGWQHKVQECEKLLSEYQQKAGL